MNKVISILLAFFLLVSCDQLSNRGNNETQQENENTEESVSIDTLALTLEALRKRRLPEGYKVVDDIKTDILIFTGFEMSDVVFYFFTNSSGDTISFSGNDSNLDLITPKPDPRAEFVLPSEVKVNKKGGDEPNPKYLNKKFRVVWRTIQLDRKPENETEFYYQEYDEIIYMKEV